MKPQLTFVLLLFCYALTAQVKFKVKLLADNTTYQVLAYPEATFSSPANLVTNAQITLRVPTGGFTIGSITNINGGWKFNGTAVAPVENPGFDYLFIGWDGPPSFMSLQEGVELPLFSFQRTGNCTGGMLPINNDTDPYMNNSSNIAPANSFVAFGQDLYSENYNAIPADCTPSGCGIEVYDVALISPSACGVADGVIEFVGTPDAFNWIEYTINYGAPGGGTIWQANDGVFDNLAAGDIFYLAARDFFGCVIELGEFELDGPLAAVVTGVDVNDPDCGGSNGSLTINAIPQNGGSLQYSMSDVGPWQNSPTFSGLAAGTYPLYVRDIVNVCQNFIGNFKLDGCNTPDCFITYNLENLGNGQYQVSFLSDTTLNFPNNETDALRVTLKVPTGGFSLTNLSSSVTGVDFVVGSIAVAPAQEPGFDYINVDLVTTGTQNVPYIKNQVTNLFAFTNAGTCQGDSIYLMASDDAFAVNTSYGQQLNISGTDTPICLGDNAAACEEAPAPPVPCTFTFELEKINGNVFQVSLISDTTLVFPNNVTSSLQITVKVPTGGFTVQALTNLLPGGILGTPAWQVASFTVAPPQDPAHDYILFSLVSGVDIVIQQGNKSPLFSFQNGGACQGGSVFIMDNDTDPIFANPNSDFSNYLLVNLEQYTPCTTSQAIDDCDNDPCASLAVGFTASDACEGEAINFTSTTTSIEPITSWNWSFGDSQSSSIESPSHTYSTSGNFEVSLTVTTESGCEATFSDFVTVFSSPGLPAQTTYNTCNGVGVVLQGPAGATTAVWNPSTSLVPPDGVSPTATPAATTVYNVTYGNGTGCETTAQITVNVANKPVFNTVVATNPSECGVQDGSIQVNAVGVGSLEYSIDNINWQASPTFSNLAAGSYNVFARNADDSCPSAYNGNPVVITAPVQPSISNVSSTNPSSCGANDGSITITAAGGNGPLQYSINGGNSFVANGGVFTNLAPGSYSIVVANNNGSCEVLGQTVVLSDPPSPTVSPVADFNLCVGATSQLNIQLSEAIASYNITGTGTHTNESVNGNTLTLDVTAVQGANNTFTVNFTGASGCVASESFTVTGLALPNASFTTSPTLCTNGEITFTFNGTAGVNANYTWTFGTGNVTFSSQDNRTKRVTYATAGTQTICLDVVENGCSDNFCMDINVTAFNPGATASVTNASCGLNNGAINLNLAGGGNYNYNWGNQITVEDPNGLAAGTYTVTITESGSGCSATASAVVGNSPGVSIANVAPTAAIDCANGGGSLAVSISGGTGPFSYNLYEAGQATIFDQISVSANSATFQNLSAGAWRVEIVDANGCTDSEMTTVTSNSSNLLATPTTQMAGCGLTNGSAAIAITGGQAPFTYSFYKDNVLQGQNVNVNGSAINLSNLAPANYAAIITDVNGCIYPALFTIQAMQANFNITATETDPSCGASDGSILLSNLPMGATFNWSVGGGENPKTGLQAGVYVVTITNNSGCTQTNTYVLSPANSADVSISSLANATCGNDNGGLIFSVAGFNNYHYEILNTGYQGQGSGSAAVQITGLGMGAYVIEVEDSGSSNCVAYETFVINGVSGITTNATVTTATACGVSDASVCFKINGGQAPFQVTSDKGTVENGPSASEFCIRGLYEGDVNVTIMDNAGCEEVNAYNVPNNFDEPELTLDSLDVQSFTCPGDAGAIMALTGQVYEIFNTTTNAKVAETPWMAAPAGTYEVTYTIGDCEVAVEVTVDGPADWSLGIAQQNNVTCQGNDGSIEVSVAGGTFPYSFEWSNGDTTEILAGAAEGEYSVTVTDAGGCTSVLESIALGSDCNDCESVFLVDTFFVELVPGLTEICLPTDLPNLGGFIATLDGGLYSGAFDVCIKSSVFYGYSQLNGLQPPFVLEEWNVNGEIITDLNFNTMTQLVDMMNTYDPLGNWADSEISSGIIGGTDISNYASMTIRHENTGTTFILMPDAINVERPSIFVEDNPANHVFMAINAQQSQCIDTLYINLVTVQPVSEEIDITVNVGEDTIICISAEELNGTPEFLFNNCISGQGNAQLVTLGGEEPGCNGYGLQILGISEGTEAACMVLCDDLGTCDTTYLNINVVDASTELVIYNALSPNEDGRNDFFRIKNIELPKYQDNTLRIFNRWGIEVYSKKGYTNSDPWFARYRNTFLPDGTYFYLLEINEQQSGGGTERKEYTGFVEVRK
jgi:gliding motility-associated-like protein